MLWRYISFAQNFKIHFSKFLYQILLSYRQKNDIIYAVKNYKNSQYQKGKNH